MKSWLALNVTFLLIFLTSGTAFAQSQYRFDTGLKISSLDQERFLLEQRFHLKSPYTLVGTYAYGSRFNSDYCSFVNHLDSTYTTEYGNYHSDFHTLKFGVQRKINSFASDVFYVGATVGVGYQTQRNYTLTSIFKYDSIVVGYSPNPEHSEVIYENFSSSAYTLLHTQLAISFGMDIPLTKRLSINAEVALLGMMSNYLEYKLNYFSSILTVSGGLRYQFGRIKLPETREKSE